MFKTIKICWLAFALATLLFTTLSITLGKQFLLPISVVTLSLLSLFFRFTITVDDNWIEYSIGIGITIGRYAIADVSNCDALEPIPPCKWLSSQNAKSLVISGYNMIELKLKNGNSIKLPTNDPYSLARFISEMSRKSNVIEA